MVAYSQALLLAWTLAAQDAYAANSRTIEPAHLMLAVCRVCTLEKRELDDTWPDDRDMVRRVMRERDEASRLLGRARIDPTDFRQRLKKLVEKPGPRPESLVVIHRDSASRELFKRAQRLAAGEGRSETRLTSLLDALTGLADPPWQPLLAEIGIVEEWNAVFQARRLPLAAPNTLPSDADARRAPVPAHRSRNTPTPEIDRIGRDLTRLAADGKLDPVLGREPEIALLTGVLARKKKRNAVLIGEAGVGKTAIVEGLAQAIAQRELGPAFEGVRLVEINIGDLVSGTMYRGQFEEKLGRIIREAADAGVVLFIDEFHTVLGAGGAEGATDAANLLKPALARGELQIIGATTIDEYRRHIERDRALSRRFQLVWVDEPGRDATFDILRRLRSDLEEHHAVEIEDSAIEAAIDLSVRYLADLRLPDKAIDLLDQACADGRIHQATAPEASSAPVKIGREEIAAVVAARCKVPVQSLTDDEGKRLLDMERILGSRVLGQAEAVATVSDALRASRAGLGDPTRPAAAFLFAGPTGTGKTELAKTLAEFLFPDMRGLIRIDMSEYMEKHAVSRLIGAPPGYVGYGDEGQLTGPVRTQPYSVVLLDEIEKAHPEVLDILLQVLDDGRLTDARGRVVSFRNAIIVMTTNLGTGGEQVDGTMGFVPSAAQDACLDPGRLRQRIVASLRQTLRPEFLNRIGDIVFFYPFDELTARAIVEKELATIRARLENSRIVLELSDEGYRALVREGFDRRYGARGFKRVIEKRIVRPLSRVLLERDRQSEGTLFAIYDGNILHTMSEEPDARPSPGEDRIESSACYAGAKSH